MNNKFDELTKSMAQSVTRRAALKKFGVGLAGMALACFGLADAAKAGKIKCLRPGQSCTSNSECCSGICYDDGNPFGPGPVCRCSTDADCKGIKEGGRQTICCWGTCKLCEFA